jgi:hypothetical protein
MVQVYQTNPMKSLTDGYYAIIIDSASLLPVNTVNKITFGRQIKRQFFAGGNNQRLFSKGIGSDRGYYEGFQVRVNYGASRR